MIKVINFLKKYYFLKLMCGKGNVKEHMVTIYKYLLKKKKRN